MKQKTSDGEEEQVVGTLGSSNYFGKSFTSTALDKLIWRFFLTICVVIIDCICANNALLTTFTNKLQKA